MPKISAYAHLRKQNQNSSLSFEQAQTRAKFLRRAADDPNLSRAALRLAIVIADMAHQSGNAWPHQSTLAAELGLHLDTVQAGLRELEAGGYIQTRRGQRGKTYFLPWSDGFRSCLQTGSDPVYRPDQNAAHLYTPERSKKVNAVVAAPPLPTTTESHPVEQTDGRTTNPDLQTARQAIQQHSIGPVGWADVTKALKSYSVAWIAGWSAHRRGKRLDHAGAVLAIMARDWRAEAEAGAAIDAAIAEQERRAAAEETAQYARWAAEEREYQTRQRMPPQATSGPGLRRAAAGD